MAVSLKSGGAWLGGIVATSQAFTIPGTPAAGDRMFVFVGWKNFDVTASINSGGWTKVAEYADGNVANGAGTGSVKVACWYRDWVSGDANPTVTFSATTSIAAGCVQLWTKGAGDFWATPTFATHAWPSVDPAATTRYENADSTVNVTDGGVVMMPVVLTVRESATFNFDTTNGVKDSAGAITWNGARVQHPTSYYNSTIGNDISVNMCHRLVTTGANGVTLQGGINDLAAASSGAMMWVVQNLDNTKSGTASGNYTWSGSATGLTPIPGAKTGTASGSYTFAGAASGKFAPKGTAASDYTWSGEAVGPTTYAPIFIASQFTTNTSANSRGGTFPSTYNPHVGDIILLLGTSTVTNTISSIAAGYQNVLGGSNVAASDSHTLAAVIHPVTIAEQNANTRTYTATGLFSSSTQGEIHGFAIRGADPSNPIDAFNSLVNSGDTTSPFLLAGLPGSDLSSKSCVISCVVKDTQGTYTDPAGYENIQSSNTYQGTWSGVLKNRTQAGVDIPDTSITPSAGDEYVSISIAFNPKPLPFGKPYDSGLSEEFQYAAEFNSATNVSLDVTAAPYNTVINNSASNSSTGIQAAINAAVAGDELYFPNGDYYIKTKLNWKSGVKFRGQSEAGVKFHAAFSASQTSMILVPAAATDCIFEKFSVDKPSGSIFDAPIRFGSANDTATSPDCQRNIVRNCTFQNYDRFGVEAHNTKFLLIDQCTFKNPTALDGGGSGYGFEIDGGSATNNWIRRSTFGPTIRHACVFVVLANHNLFGGLMPDGSSGGNVVEGAVSGAIECHGEIEYANEISYNTVKNNVRDGTTQSPNGGGIEVGEPPTDEVLGGSGHGRSSTQNWLHHNTIFNCPHGIRIMNQSNWTYVEDNIMYNCDNGIIVDQETGYSNTGVDHTLIARNLIYNCINGITLIDVTTNTGVYDNVVHDCTGTGLLDDVNNTNYDIRRNLIYNNATNRNLTGTGTFVPAGGSLATTYTWAGTATGATPTTPPKTGTASGAYTWAGAATGKRTPKGTAGSNYTWSSTASGKRTPKGSVASNYTWAGTAVGDAPPNRGTASGAYTWAGAATGKRVTKGTASSNYTWICLASGDNPPDHGAASATYGWAGTASGLAPILPSKTGTASGAYTWSGAATGKKVPKATGTGAYTWSSAAIGKRTPKAVASANYTWSSNAAGRRVSQAIAAGGYSWSGTAVGSTPLEDQQSGSGFSSYEWAATASGITNKFGTCSASYTWAAVAIGKRTSRGTVGGSYTFAAVAVGRVQNKGTAGANYTWIKFALGVSHPFGSAAGGFTWSGSGSGVGFIPTPGHDINQPIYSTALYDRFRFICEEARTGNILSRDLTVQAPKILRALSGPCNIQFDINYHDYMNAGIYFKPWGHLIHVEKLILGERKIWASGLVVPSQIDKASGVMHLEAQGFAGYPKGTPWLENWNPLTIDPFAVVHRIWDHLQSYSNGDLGVEVYPMESGLEMLPGYAFDGELLNLDFFAVFIRAEDKQDCQDWIDKLARDIPFDYVEQSGWNEDRTSIWKKIYLGYPKAGVQQDNLAFVINENVIEAAPHIETQTDWASDIIIDGWAPGTEYSSQISNADPLRYRRVVTQDDARINSTERAAAWARRKLTRRQTPAYWESIIVDMDHPNAPFGYYDVGDRIWVKGPMPWVGDVNQLHKIIAIAVDEDKGNCQLTLKAEGAFEYDQIYYQGSTGTGSKTIIVPSTPTITVSADPPTIG